MPTTTVTVQTEEHLKQVVADYLDFDEFAFDIETVATRDPRHKDKDKPALDVMTNEVWCVSLAGPARSDVIPCGHPHGPDQLMKTQVFDALEPLFFSDRRKINQNVKFDLLSIAKYYRHRRDPVPPPPYGDTVVAAFLLNENLPAYRLGALSERYLGYTYVEKLGEEAYSVEFERAVRYSIVDAKMAWLLWWKMRPVFTRNRHLEALLELEMDVLGVLMDMYVTGAYVDEPRFGELQIELTKKRVAIEKEARELANRHFPATFFNSPKQRSAYFYKELGLKCPVRTDKGAESTNVQALRVLARRNKVAKALLTYSDVNKMLSTYIDGYRPHIEDDSRIRCSFNQAVAKTGRLSSSAPNLQNIPARYRENTEGMMVRRLFLAPPGYKLVVADYSQIELRILAHLTGDQMLLRAYREGIDLHTQTAALIFGVKLEAVTKEQRMIGKTCNFAFAFEGGPSRLEEMAGVSYRQAIKVYESWHRAYPAVKRWGKLTKARCSSQGYVTTLYGRRRRLPEIYSADPKLRGYAERQAVNHPIQGLAADIAKIALVQIHEALGDCDAHLVLQIHDEFIVEVAESDVAQVVPLVREAMEDVQLNGGPVLSVPLVADINIGGNWAEAKG